MASMEQEIAHLESELAEVHDLFEAKCNEVRRVRARAERLRQAAHWASLVTIDPNRPEQAEWWAKLEAAVERCIEHGDLRPLPAGDAGDD